MKKDLKARKINHKACFAAAVMTLAIGVTACGSDKINENKDPLTGEDTSQQESSGDDETGNEGMSEESSSENEGDLSAFDEMLKDERNDANSIIDYINTNIVSAGANDIKKLFAGLLSFGDDIRNIDFTRLDDSRQYMPEDMIAFMDLMKLEADTPSMVMSDDGNRRVINMTLSEMLERARLFEQHIEKYPDAVTTEAAERLYEEIATNAISGGYNKTEGISHYYKGDDENVIDQKALKYYQQFAEANPDSNLGKIVQEYVGLLQSNNFQIDDKMNDYYMSLHQKLGLTNIKNASQNKDNAANGNTDTEVETGSEESTDNTGTASR